MPKKHIPTSDAFTGFFKDITERLGCKQVSAREVVDWVESIPATEPLSRYKQSQTGIETGYKYANPKSPADVVIWTTYVAGNQQARESDAGWVLLIERTTRKPIFFSFPIHRTKNFLATLTRYIEVFIELADNWPAPCPKCSQVLTIKPVPGVLLGKTFACPQNHRVRGWIYQGLSEASKKFLEARYRSYAKYRDALAENGAQVTPRVFIRSGAAVATRKKNDKGFTSQESHHDENFSQVNPRADEYPFDDLRHEQ